MSTLKVDTIQPSNSGNALSILTGANVLRMKIEADGRIGHGKSPGAGVKLDIDSTAVATYGLRVDTQGRPDSTGYVWFGDTTVPDFFINTSGHVGIGTATPSRPLHVVGSIAVSYETTGASPSTISNTSANNLSINAAAGLQLGVVGNTKINISTNTIGISAGRFIVRPDGLSPLSFDLPATFIGARYTFGGHSTVMGIFSNDLLGANIGAGIALGGIYTANAEPTSFAEISGVKSNATPTNFAGDLVLKSRVNGGSLTERMRILSGGNVGIGTATPGATLDIKGSVAMGGAQTIDFDGSTIQTIGVIRHQMKTTVQDGTQGSPSRTTTTGDSAGTRLFENVYRYTDNSTPTASRGPFVLVLPASDSANGTYATFIDVTVNGFNGTDTGGFNSYSSWSIRISGYLNTDQDSGYNNPYWYSSNAVLTHTTGPVPFSKIRTGYLSGGGGNVTTAPHNRTRAVIVFGDNTLAVRYPDWRIQTIAVSLQNQFGSISTIQGQFLQSLHGTEDSLSSFGGLDNGLPAIMDSSLTTLTWPLIQAYNGNVGINVLQPFTKLHIHETNDKHEQLLLSNSGLHQTGIIGSSPTGTETYLGNTKAWGIHGGPSAVRTGLANRLAISIGSGVPDFSILTGANFSTSTVGTPRFTVLGTNGNVGIGTASPLSKLHIANGDIGLDITQKLILRASDPGASYLTYDNNFTERTRLIADYGVYIGSSGLNGITIKTAGHVGIGTTLPAFTLDVNGTGRFTRILPTTGKDGSFGIFDPTTTQHVWGMGTGYTLGTGGSANYGNFYGLGWSYNPGHNGAGNNPQSKAGLNHQLLLMNNAITQTAIGAGIWTIGNVSSNPAPTVGDHLTNKTYVDSNSRIGSIVMIYSNVANANASPLSFPTGIFTFSIIGSTGLTISVDIPQGQVWRVQWWTRGSTGTVGYYHYELSNPSGTTIIKLGGGLVTQTKMIGSEAGYSGIAIRVS